VNATRRPVDAVPVPRRASGPPALSAIGGGDESGQVDDRGASGGGGDGGKQRAARIGGLVGEREGRGGEGKG